MQQLPGNKNKHVKFDLVITQAIVSKILWCKISPKDGRRSILCPTVMLRYDQTFGTNAQESMLTIML